MEDSHRGINNRNFHYLTKNVVSLCANNILHNNIIMNNQIQIPWNTRSDIHERFRV